MPKAIFAATNVGLLLNPDILYYGSVPTLFLFFTLVGHFYTTLLFFTYIPFGSRSVIVAIMSNSTSNSTASSDVQSAFFGAGSSMPMAWIAGIAISIMFMIHVIQYFRYKGYYLYLLMLGLTLEVIGLWMRVLAIRLSDNSAVAGFTYLLLTVGPSFFAATCYMTFGRIVYWVSPEEKRTFKYTWVPARWITTTFVSLDIIGFIISCSGIFAFISNISRSDLTAEQKAYLPYQVLKVGFVWQIVVFFLFTIIALHFMFSSKAYEYDWPEGSGQWRKTAWTVFIAMAILTGRSFYRSLCFALNNGDNYLRANEWTFYLFDFVPIISLLTPWALVNPGKHIPREYTTIGHAYKQTGFRMPTTKEIIDEAEADEDAQSGYINATLAAPGVNTYGQQTPQFSDPWARKDSTNIERI